MNADSRSTKLTTNHYAPWALIRRGGDTLGKRPNTRMAFLVGTIAPDGRAIALTGYVMRNDMTGWSKSVRRIEWANIVKQWHHQPTIEQVRRAKTRMAPITAECDRLGWGSRAASLCAAEG